MSEHKILFVDDEANVLSALRRSLRKEPYNLFFAESPEEAMTILENDHIDLVVSDHLMPSTDGLTFLKLVRDLYPDVIRIILTGAADVRLAIEAINEGEVFRFLTKPWNDLDLKVILKLVFDFLDLRRENQVLLETVRKQKTFINKMETEHPGIFEVKRTDSGAIVIELDMDEDIASM